MILAGDIGGTNARFGYYARGERRAVANLLTADFDTAADLLAAALEQLAGGAVEACCLAVAGPVFDDHAQLTNGTLAFSRQGVAACLQAVNGGTSLDAARVHLVNDLVGLGSAVAMGSDDYERLCGAPSEGAGGVKGVVAVGTGLGMATIVDGKCLPSEGGHARIAPVGGFERELLAATESLAEVGDAIAWEHYLSGPGIETLYRAVCNVWGAQPETIGQQTISSRALADADPLCHTTLETWVGMLATACGGLAVTALTLGGVYVAGPLPVAAAAWLRDQRFHRRFKEAAWAADYLQDVPVYLIADAYAGLDGAYLIAENAARPSSR